MKREAQVQWLKIRRKSFFRHVITYGLGFCIPLIVGSEFVRNDFYLDLSFQASYKLYLTTIFGAVFFAGCDWVSRGCQYRKYKEGLVRKNTE